jgi:hypothetical protein
MGEFNKDPNQGGTGKEQQGGKPAFDQFEKGQQGQQDQQQFGEKTPDYDQEKSPGQQQQEGGQKQFGEKTPDYSQERAPGQQQQEGADKPQFGTEKEQTGEKQQGDFGGKPDA